MTTTPSADATAAEMADIVEGLRATPCDREPFTSGHADCICRTANTAADEINRLRDLIDEIADMGLADPEIEHRAIIDRCRAEQRRWTGEDA